jgi:hypothetical protein
VRENSGFLLSPIQRIGLRSDTYPFSRFGTHERMTGNPEVTHMDEEPASRTNACKVWFSVSSRLALPGATRQQDGRQIGRERDLAFEEDE